MKEYAIFNMKKDDFLYCINSASLIFNWRRAHHAYRKVFVTHENLIFQNDYAGCSLSKFVELYKNDILIVPVDKRAYYDYIRAFKL